MGNQRELVFIILVKGWFMRYYIRKITALGIMALCFALTKPLPAVQAARLQDMGDKIVIVIDPGHGGDNLGTTENDHEEKRMTMVTAQAMYDELALYENVEVYLTRTDDRKLSLKERAEFAASVDADFLFSIHYNASETHESFGAEAWVSLKAPYNAYGYQFGCEFLKNMREMGLLVRGVKTRIGDSGDYYGVIRESVALGIPAMILEHCHVDEKRDEGFCSDDEKLVAFGKADADAAAKYFGLRSSVLGVDYSGYELSDADEDVIAPFTRQDQTAPDVCQIEFVKADYETGALTLSVSAADYDSVVLYYSYSLDGGETFSPREAWPGSDTLAGSYLDTFTLDIDVPSGTTPQVVVRAYNLYDFYSNSNVYKSPQAFFQSAPKENAADVTGNGMHLSGEKKGASRDGSEADYQNDSAGEFKEEPADGFAEEEKEMSAKELSAEKIRDGNQDVKDIPVDAAIDVTSVRPEFSLASLILVCLLSVVLLSLMIYVIQSIADGRRGRRHKF